MPSWDSKNHREFLDRSSMACFVREIEEDEGCNGCFRCFGGMAKCRVCDSFFNPHYAGRFLHQAWDGIGFFFKRLADFISTF